MIRHAATVRRVIAQGRKVRAFHASAALSGDALDMTDTFLRRHGTFWVDLSWEKQDFGFCGLGFFNRGVELVNKWNVLLNT